MGSAAAEGAGCSEAAGLVSAGACAGLPQARALEAAGLAAPTAAGASAFAGIDVLCCDSAAEAVAVATEPFA